MPSQRVIYERFGDPQQVLRVERRELPQLHSGELLVRMLERPINPSDLIPIKGSYAHRIQLPGVPGYEGVGIVIAAGDTANRDMIGKRVLPLRGEGTWQTHVRTPAATAIEVPAVLGDGAAAQAYINPLTAWISCTDVLGLGAGDCLLVNAGGSAIGRIYAQLSRQLGFELIAIVRDSRHAEDLRRLGAAHVIVAAESAPADGTVDVRYVRGPTAAPTREEAVGLALAGGGAPGWGTNVRESVGRAAVPAGKRAVGFTPIGDATPELAEAVRELTGGVGATAAIDSVGGASGAALAGCVRPGGRLLTIGLLSGQAVPWGEVAARTGVRVDLFHLRHWIARVPVSRWREEMACLLEWMAAGQLELLPPASRYELADVGEAVRAAETPGAGKILLV